jgi:hypothetical protein
MRGFRAITVLGFVALFLAAVPTLTACGGSTAGGNGPSIESVVRSYYDATAEGDQQRFEGTLCDSESDGFLSAFSLWQEASDSEKDEIRVTSVDAHQHGTTAQVDVTFKDGSADAVSLSLEGGRWCITSAVTGVPPETPPSL